MLSTSRRCKVLHIPEAAVVDAFARTWNPPPQCVPVMRCPEMPPDARVLAIDHDFYRKTFAVLIEHDAFPEVPVGQSFPDFHELGSVVNEVIEIRPSMVSLMASLDRRPPIKFDAEWTDEPIAFERQ